MQTNKHLGNELSACNVADETGESVATVSAEQVWRGPVPWHSVQRESLAVDRRTLSPRFSVSIYRHGLKAQQDSRGRLHQLPPAQQSAPWPVSGTNLILNVSLLLSPPRSCSFRPLNIRILDKRSSTAAAGHRNRHRLRRCGADLSVGIPSSVKVLLTAAERRRCRVPSLHSAALHMRNSTATLRCSSRHRLSKSSTGLT